MGRAPCCDKANVKKGPWSPEEDAKLKAYIEQKGTGGNWIALPQKIGLKRCGKSCRLRWLNYLRPNIKHGGFTEEEENIICSLYISIGSRWSIIAGQLPGRTDNDIKNYWNTRLKKKLMAKQRKEQAACRAAAGFFEQEIKRENETFLVNQTLNQLPYWPPAPEHPTSSSMMMHYSNNPAASETSLISNQDQLNKLLMTTAMKFNDHHHNQYYYDESQFIHQFPITQDQVYVDNNEGVDMISNYTQWLINPDHTHHHQFDVVNNNYDVVNAANHKLDPNNESCGTAELGNSTTTNSRTTSNSAGSNISWGDMNSLVNTPVSSFDAYQNPYLGCVE